MVNHDTRRLASHGTWPAKGDKIVETEVIHSIDANLHSVSVITT